MNYAKLPRFGCGVGLACWVGGGVVDVVQVAVPWLWWCFLLALYRVRFTTCGRAELLGGQRVSGTEAVGRGIPQASSLAPNLLAASLEMRPRSGVRFPSPSSPPITQRCVLCETPLRHDTKSSSVTRAKHNPFKYLHYKRNFNKCSMLLSIS